MMSHRPYLEIACQQVMAEDASVFSVQWVDLPATMVEALSAKELLARYLGYINKCTLTLIRPTTIDNGIEFRLFGTGQSLISFMPPEYSDGSAILRICDGFLVQPRRRDRGELRFMVEHASERVRITLQLSDFCPLLLGSSSPSPLRFWLYRFTQAAIHRMVTVRFLAMLYQELVGPSAGVRVANVAIRTGKPV